MKVFQVADKHSKIIEAVLDSISRAPEGEDVDCFVFGMVYKDGRYTTGDVNASPYNMAMVAGYIQLDANLRYVKLNKEWIDNEVDSEGEI